MLYLIIPRVAFVSDSKKLSLSPTIVHHFSPCIDVKKETKLQTITLCMDRQTTSAAAVSQVSKVDPVKGHGFLTPWRGQEPGGGDIHCRGDFYRQSTKASGVGGQVIICLFTVRGVHSAL